MGADSSDELDLGKLFRFLWREKWIIASGALLGGIVSLGIALSLPNVYRSTAVLIPASESGGGDLSRIAGQLGGLAALAGVNLTNNKSDDKTVIAMELLKSWGFIEDFIREHRLEIPVFAAKGWDSDKNELIIDPDIYDAVRQTWVPRRMFLRKKEGPPTGWELYRKLVEKIAVSQDKKTGLITLSVEFYSPTFAKDLVDKLVAAVNSRIQQQDRDEALRNILFLEKKLQDTSLSGMQQMFSRLIEEQTKTLMLADVSSEYALKTISAAKVPEEKSGPPRAFILFAGILLGGGVGALVGVLRYVRRSAVSSTVALG